MMRILHLTTEFRPVIYGGLGTAVGGLVKASANAGIATGVLLFGDSAGAAYGRLVLLPKSFSRVPTIRSAAWATIFEVSWFQGIDAIAQTAATWRPDILHLHSFWLWPIAQELCARFDKPLVYTVHSLDRAEYELHLDEPLIKGLHIKVGLFFGPARQIKRPFPMQTLALSLVHQVSARNCQCQK
jgi:glycogen synthase